MAHKVMVDGTAYGISEGITKDGGTGYVLQMGVAKVDGTLYDISFGSGLIPVTITSSGNASYCYVTINGTKYSSETSGIEVEAGSEIGLSVRARSSSVRGYIYINGTTVKTVQTTMVQTYDWIVPNDCKTISIALSYGSSQCYVRVTTT